MDERIYQAFDAVQADEALKAKTLAAVTERLQVRRPHPVCRWAAVAACVMVLAGFGGYRVYATPTATVRIDLPQAVELEVNRFGRVVEATGTNAAVCHQSYEAALTAIFEDLSTEGVTVAVDGDPAQCAAISDAVERCSGGRAHCYGWGGSDHENREAQGGHNGNGWQHRHGKTQ